MLYINFVSLISNQGYTRRINGLSACIWCQILGITHSYFMAIYRVKSPPPQQAINPRRFASIISNCSFAFGIRFHVITKDKRCYRVYTNILAVRITTALTCHQLILFLLSCLHRTIKPAKYAYYFNAINCQLPHNRTQSDVQIHLH